MNKASMYVDLPAVNSCKEFELFDSVLSFKITTVRENGIVINVEFEDAPALAAKTERQRILMLLLIETLRQWPSCFNKIDTGELLKELGIPFSRDDPESE